MANGYIHGCNTCIRKSFPNNKLCEKCQNISTGTHLSSECNKNCYWSGE